MKKLIGRISILLFTSLISYIIVVLIILKLGIDGWLPENKILSGEGFTLLKVREIKKYSNIDVLFLGSSNVYRGIDTRLFYRNGIKAFNLGTSSQSPYNSYYLLKEYFPVVKPKHVVLDLYWPLVAEDGTESTVDVLSNHKLTWNMVEMAVRTHNMVTIRNLVSVSLFRLFTPLEKIEVKQQKADGRVYTPGGFVAANYSDTAKKHEQFAHLDTKIKLPVDLQLEYLHKIIAFCRANNTKLLFILVPVSREFKNNLTNYKVYTNTIVDLAKKNNVPFVDYNESPKLSLSSDADYVDKNHLSADGAVKFTKVLLDDFSALTHKKQSSIASN
jgi:hypothetical protein